MSFALHSYCCRNLSFHVLIHLQYASPQHMQLQFASSFLTAKETLEMEKHYVLTQKCLHS